MPSFIPNNITLFSTPAEFRKWLDENHQTAKELWVGFHKKETGKPCITWSESVDQALCYGWIDGIRKSLDAASYTIRFTPRNPKSIWSAVNIKKVEELSGLGLMQPRGLQAYNNKDAKKSELYSYEQRKGKLDVEYEQKLKANAKAWKFFQSQAPSYQRTAIYWITSAKQEETRSKRLEILIKDSEDGLKIAPLRTAKRKNT
jgi:uncharacterized protein YdeI (YjbR/CyaY-like superfamily)